MQDPGQASDNPENLGRRAKWRSRKLGVKKVGRGGYAPKVGTRHGPSGT